MSRLPLKLKVAIYSATLVVLGLVAFFIRLPIQRESHAKPPAAGAESPIQCDTVVLAI